MPDNQIEKALEEIRNTSFSNPSTVRHAIWSLCDLIAALEERLKALEAKS